PFCRKLSIAASSSHAVSVQKAFLASRKIRPPRNWGLRSALRATLRVCQKNGGRYRSDLTLRRVTEINGIFVFSPRLQVTLPAVLASLRKEPATISYFVAVPALSLATTIR